MGVLNQALTQIIIIGFLAFASPGIFNSLSGIGRAGQANADAANTANATLYACFAVFGYFGGTVFNLLGEYANRVLMCVGGATYGVYTLLIWISSNVEGTGWLAVLAGAVLGVGAGWFWTAQGTQMLSYSTERTRGKYIYIFWTIFNLGGMLGGLLSAILNWNSEDEGEANPASYFTFMGVMFAGSLASLFLLVNPNTVVREDGTKVDITPPGSAMDEIKGALKVATNKYMLLLAIYFLGTNWPYTLAFNHLNGALFNIRTRGINSALFWGSQMFGAYILGVVLDSQRLTKRQRAFYGYAMATVSFGVAWILGFVVRYGFEDGYDKDNEIIDRIDITESSRCGLPIFTYVCFGLGDAAMQSFAYWIIGALAGGSLSLNANFAGYYKGIQSAGAAVAWGIDLNENILYSTQMWIAFSIWAVGSLLACGVAQAVKNEEDTKIARLESEQV